MPQSALQLDIHALREEVSFFMGKGRVWNDVSDDEKKSIDAIISAGLRMFYGAYPWSFLHIDAALSLEAGTYLGDLPDDFGFLNGDVTITDGARTWPMRQVSQTEIDLAKKEIKAVPKVYSIYPKQMTDNAVGQGWQLAVWPVPDRDLTFQYRYNVQPRMISVTAPYPYGGMYHSETIREACLSKAESEMEDQPGVHTQMYQVALQNSISFDKNQAAPDSLGYNGNGRRLPPNKRQINMYVNGVDINAPTESVVEKVYWEE